MTLQNKSIFLVIPTLSQGGAERVMSELANTFVKVDGLEVNLILLADAPDFYEIDKNVRVYRLGFKNKGIFSKIASQISVFIKLRKLLRDKRPNTVLSFMEKYNILTILASSFLKINVFVSDRSNPFNKEKFFIKMGRRLTYRYVSGIVSQTPLSKQFMENVTKHQNIIVIPNPVKEIIKYPTNTPEKIILSLGRLVPEKGQKYLVEAFSKIKDRQWRLVILGEGPLRDELEIQVDSLGIGDRVLLPGSSKEVDLWFSKASIFVLSSVSEGFPNALLEAMSAGVASISFDCETGPREIIRNRENGLLIETANVHELTKGLNVLIDDEELRKSIAVNGRLVSEEYNIESISMRYLNFCLNSDSNI